MAMCYAGDTALRVPIGVLNTRIAVLRRLLKSGDHFTITAYENRIGCVNRNRRSPGEMGVIRSG